MVATRLKLSHATNEYLSRRKMAVNTQQNYRAALKALADEIRDDPWIDNVTALHVEAVLDRYDNPSVYNVRLSQYRTFLNWCKKQRYVSRNVVDTIDSRKVTTVGAMSKHRIPLESWPELLKAAGDYHPLNRAFVATGLYLGQRGCELSAIRIGDLHRGDDGAIEAITVTRTKTGEVAEVPVFEELAEELEMWLAWYKKCLGVTALPPNAFLLPGRIQGRRVRGPDGRMGRLPSDAPVDPYKRIGRPFRIVQQALKDAGWYKHGEGAHTLRRSIAVAMFKQDVDDGFDGALDNVKTLLGHAKSATTEDYLGVNLGKHRLNQRVKGRRLAPAAEVPDNVIEFGERHG